MSARPLEESKSRQRSKSMAAVTVKIENSQQWWTKWENANGCGCGTSTTCPLHSVRGLFTRPASQQLRAILIYAALLEFSHDSSMGPKGQFDQK